ncbi:hypothetical protein Tco_0295785 [Tanacetum coccineum]
MTAPRTYPFYIAMTSTTPPRFGSKKISAWFEKDTCKEDVGGMNLGGICIVGFYICVLVLDMGDNEDQVRCSYAMRMEMKWDE